MNNMRLIYMSHPVSGPFFELNVIRANQWFRFLRSLSNIGVRKLLGFDDKVIVTRYKATNPGVEVSAGIERPLTYSFVAPWLTAIVPDGEYPGGRDKALVDACVAARACDELWFVGGNISGGMREEASFSQRVRDLTHYGVLPPSWSNQSELFLPKGGQTTEDIHGIPVR